MKIKSTMQGGELCVTLSGEIDQVGAQELKKHFSSLVLSDVREVKIDFHGVTYIGSAGVGKLLLLYKQLPAHDIAMELTGLSPDLLHLFREMELDSVFTLSARS